MNPEPLNSCREREIELGFAGPDSRGSSRPRHDRRSGNGTLAQCDRTTHSCVITQFWGHNIVVDAVAKQSRGYHVIIEHSLNLSPDGSEEGILTDLAPLADAAADDHPSRRKRADDVGDRVSDVLRFVGPCGVVG